MKCVHRIVGSFHRFFRVLSNCITPKPWHLLLHFPLAARTKTETEWGQNFQPVQIGKQKWHGEKIFFKTPLTKKKKSTWLFLPNNNVNSFNKALTFAFRTTWDLKIKLSVQPAVTPIITKSRAQFCMPWRSFDIQSFSVICFLQHLWHPGKISPQLQNVIVDMS